MPNLNQVTLIGHLGKDPEIRSTSQSEVASFSLATSSCYKLQNGEWKEEVQWHNIELWNPSEYLKANLRKGVGAIVEGTIRYEHWEKDGVKRTATKIRAHRVQVLKAKEQGQNNNEPAHNDNEQNENEQNENEQDLPF